MISLCFFIFVLSNSATCEIFNKSTKVLKYGSPGNPMGTVIVNINGSFNNIYIWGPGNSNNNHNNNDKTTEWPGTEIVTETPSVVYDSCEDAVGITHRTGIFKIQIPNSIIEPFEVYCMMDSHDGSAWTVIQRRTDGMVNFNQNWLTYESGFGDLKADFFLGLKKINELTRLEDYRLWIELVDWKEARRYASYDTFSIDDASNKYKIELGKYKGDVDNALEDQNSQKFSTFDSDNDNAEYRNCAAEHKSGWWLKNCHQSNLNGPYEIDIEGKGIRWHTWHGFNYSLKHTLMAMQPKRI